MTKDEICLELCKTDEGRHLLAGIFISGIQGRDTVKQHKAIVNKLVSDVKNYFLKQRS